MRRLERAQLLETLAGFDDPLEMLLACHRRIEKQLETLKRLRAHIEAHGVDAEASAAAQAILRYFLKAGVNHHQDEEHDLFPLLAQRIGDPGESARFAHFRQSLEDDHRKLEAAWQRLRRPLEGIAEGLTRTLPEAEVHAFVDAYVHHILTEESTLQEFCTRWLAEEDRRQLGHAMAARRMVPPPRT
jgi:hemerythrin-like domain-containing protein